MNAPSRIIPDLDGANAPHWLGAREGKVVVQVCDDCNTPRYPRADLCPVCSSAASTWKSIRPTGRVRSWCRFHRAYFPEFKDRMPYTVLLVRMDDGVNLFGNFAADAMQDIPVIGQRVEAAFEEVSPGVSLVRFRAIAGVGA